MIKNHKYICKHIISGAPLVFEKVRQDFEEEKQQEEEEVKAEDERGMEDTEMWLISFVILPDRKQTYRLKNRNRHSSTSIY